MSRPSRPQACLRGQGTDGFLRRDERHGPLGERGDGEGRIDAQVLRDLGAVADDHVLVTPDPVPLVDDAFLGRRPEGTPSQDVGRDGRVDGHFRDDVGSHSPDPSRQPAAEIVPGRKPGRMAAFGAGLRRQDLDEGEEPGPGQLQVEIIVEGLHDQENDRLAGPAGRIAHPQMTDRMPQLVPQPAEKARRPPAAVGQRGDEGAHGVVAAAETDRFEVRVRVGMDARGDGHAPGVVGPGGEVAYTRAASRCWSGCTGRRGRTGWAAGPAASDREGGRWCPECPRR